MNFITRLPWITAPLIVGAPMRVFAGPELAVSVSAAGGLGFLGPNTKTENMRSDLEKAREIVTAQNQSSNHLRSTAARAGGTLPIGVGFQLWNDDLKVATQLIQQYQPCVAWLYAPHDEKDFTTWSAGIRGACPDTQIWIQLGTVAEVQRLLERPHKPDVIVVQGAEAGGHGRAEDGIGVVTLVPEVVDLLHQHRVDIPVIAAGGIADGRGAAAALCLGARGVAMGTRFLATSEARISKGYQQEVVRASDAGTSTTRTLLYNHLRGTFGWPKPYSPRTIINRSHIEHKDGIAFDELKTRHDEAASKGDEGWGPEGRLATYAGASIGLIRDVKPAAHIVRDVQAQFRSISGNLPGASDTRSSL